MTAADQIVNKKTWPKTYVAIILFVCIGFALYLNTFGNKLFWDDYYQITQNTYVSSFNIPKIFTTNISAGAGRSDNFYRPIVTLSFATDYKLWKDNPVGFHFTNLALHILSAILIYLIFSTLQSRKSVAFLTSFLFLAHPVQTESVTYVSSRTELMPVFFMLLSLHFFIKIFKNSPRKKLFYILSLTSFGLALLSKEISVIFPVLLLIVYLSFIEKVINKTNFKNIILKTLPFFSLSAIYAALRFTVLKFSNDYVNINQDVFKGLLTFLKALITYWKIILVPLGLHFRLDWSLPIVKWDPKIITSALIVAAIVYVAAVSLKRNKTVLFGFSWFFVSLIPASGILIPINYALGERWLRLPSIGLFFMASVMADSALSKLAAHKLLKKIFIILIASYLVFLSVVTIRINKLWRGPISYFNYLIKYYPNDLGTRVNLGIAYDEAGQRDLAMEQYQKALEIDPNQAIVHFNLGGFYADRKKFNKAIEEYKKTIELDKNFTESYFNLAKVYVTLKEYDDAIDQMQKLHDLLPKSWKPFLWMGQVYVLKGDYAAARESFSKALSLDPENEKIKKELGSIP